jgi:hypothetical protein
MVHYGRFQNSIEKPFLSGYNLGYNFQFRDIGIIFYFAITA